MGSQKYFKNLYFEKIRPLSVSLLQGVLVYLYGLQSCPSTNFSKLWVSRQQIL